jgi:hypothetical protein
MSSISTWEDYGKALSNYTDDRLLELRMLPGTDLDDYVTSVVAFGLLLERGYSEEFLMNMVANHV